MSNKQEFINIVEMLFAESRYPISNEAMAYFEQIKNAKEKEQQQFTENGAKVLRWMQEHYTEFNNVMKAKDIAEGLFLATSRAASGALRKLITDGYVMKIEGTPICYSLTDLGMSCAIPEVAAEEN